MKTLIKGGNVVFSKNNEILKQNIIIDNDKISGFTSEIIVADKVIDAKELYVFPGFIDMHAHFRDPGQLYKENLKTGLKAALRGGITTVLCMPNTNPPISNLKVIKDIYNRAKKLNLANLIISACATKDRNGEDIYNYEEILKYICAVSDDGNGIQNAKTLQNVLESCLNLNIPYLSHCQDETLNTHIHESEELMVAREVIYSKLTSAKVHIQHISTEFSLKLIEFAKNNNINVSCEVCPHHIFLDETNITKDGEFKMNPPLRYKNDRIALVNGLKKGMIDAIASDHAPHSQEEKKLNYNEALFGVSGIEIMTRICFTKLMEYGLCINTIADKFTKGPAKILNLKNKGKLECGFDADITIMDFNKKNIISSKNLVSKGKNIAFDGFRANLDIIYTIVGGNIKWQNGFLEK
ncbi:MAG: dihydroorotase [Candidatus Muirbacterium halophilum]|nr:dihydroorotase [Candidatus Muirbacterium halophilum]MCK9476078.1 dihydroorotase [Candidatus Muirbacterium halophilum]